MKSAFILLAVLLAALPVEANPESEMLFPTAINKILSKVNIGTEREELLKRIKEEFPDSYFSEQVGGLATAGIHVRLNERFELGAKLKSGEDGWVISENKYYLTDIQTKTCIIISIEPLKRFNASKVADSSNKEAEQDGVE